MAKSKRPMIIKRDDSSFDKLTAHFIDPAKYPLSPKQEEILERLNMVYNLRLKQWSPKMIVHKLEKEFNIKQAQAYIDIRQSEQLFGIASKSEAEAARELWVQYAMDFLKRCRHKRDRANEAKALKMLAEFGGWNTEDNPDFNPEKLEQVEVVFKIPKQYLPFLKTAANQGVDDLNLTEPLDIDHEEIN